MADFFSSPWFVVIYAALVFVLYWELLSKKPKFQNTLLLVSSYVFYGIYKWQFLFLILFSTIIDFVSAEKIKSAKSPNIKKLWLYSCIGINLSLLLFFKYYNFFVDIASIPASVFNISLAGYKLDLLVPLGISFYTFHGLSYVIDVYKGKCDTERGFINYALFISFFPLMLAGPIERAGNLLVQIRNHRMFKHDLAIKGLRLILWGLFKKIFMASLCAVYVDRVYLDPAVYSGGTHLIVIILFLFQVYFDFSGYSDIAIGLGGLFGFHVVRNFNLPLFSTNLREFWRRWHMSLGSWLKDYVYIPLGGGRNGHLIKFRNIIIVFALCGLWHGADFKFLIWGILHGLALVLSELLSPVSVRFGNLIHTRLVFIVQSLNAVLVVLVISLICVFFRATYAGQAFEIFGLMTSKFFTGRTVLFSANLPIALAFTFFVEFLSKDKEYELAWLQNVGSHFFRWVFYILILFVIVFNSSSTTQYIYFQF